MSVIYKTKMISSEDEGLIAYIEDTYDKKQLSELIWDTQELKVKPILGSALYAEILDQIKTSTLTTLNSTLLLEHINPVMKYYTLSFGSHLFSYKIRNKGIVQQSSDNAQPTSMADLDRLISGFESNGQVFADRLMRFLIQNSTSYPLYLKPGTGVDTLIPTGQQANIGWYMGRSIGKLDRNGYNPFKNGEENTVDL